MSNPSRKDVNILVLTGAISSKPYLNKMRSGQMCLRFDLKNLETFLLKDGSKASHSNIFYVEVLGRNAEKYQTSLGEGDRVQITGYLRHDFIDNTNIFRVRCLHLEKE